MNIIDSLRDNELSPYKIWAQYEKLLTLAKGGDVCPSTLELDVFGGCNHFCRWCVDPAGSHNNAVLDTNVAGLIMKDAYALGLRGIVFKGGGEPALHPNFAKILRMAKEIGFDIGVISNGTNLKQLSDAYLDTLAYIRISVDGATPETRKEIHGVMDFDELKSAITEFTAKRQKRHPVIGLSFCMEYTQAGEIPHAISLGEETSVDYVLIRPIFGEEIGYKPSHSPKEAALLRTEIVKHAANYKGDLLVMAGDWKGDNEFLSGYETPTVSKMTRRDAFVQNQRFNGIEHLTGRCPAAGLILVVTADLEVYFCCCTRNLRQFRMGILQYDRNAFTLRDFWESAAYKPQLERLKHCECLPFCTHPMEKYNKVIEYLSLEQKHHVDFV